MSSDGGIHKKLILDWQSQFLENSRLYLREFFKMLNSNICEIMDNTSVVLSKISNLYCSDLQENKKLWERILELSSSKPDCFGGGGDISSEEINAGVSEFLLLNLNFIVKYAASRHH